MSAVCFFEIAAKPKELCKKKPVVCGYTCYEAFESYLYKSGKNIQITIALSPEGPGGGYGNDLPGPVAGAQKPVGPAAQGLGLQAAAAGIYGRP